MQIPYISSYGDGIMEVFSFPTLLDSSFSAL